MTGGGENTVTLTGRATCVVVTYSRVRRFSGEGALEGKENFGGFGGEGELGGRG